MLVNLREVYLPVMIFSIILDYQLAIYFLYLYRKHRQDKIGLNKFLLTFSTIFAIGATSYIFLIIGSFYVPDIILADLFIRFGVSLLQAGILLVLLILLSKPFRNLINSPLIKVISVLSGISVIYALFLYVELLGLLPCILIGLIGGAYYMYFQIKLIKLTSGSIHLRLLITLVGELIFLIGMFLGSGSLNVPELAELKDILYIVGSYVVNFGLLLVLYGTIKFPGVPEFEWKNKLLKLYVVDAMNLYELYSYDFSRSRIFVDDTKPTYSNDVNNSLNSIGVVGISDVFDEITKTYQNRVKTIKYGKFSILLEYEEDPKSQFLFVLFVDTDMKSLELFLKKVKNQFLTTYKSLLTTYDIVERFRESLFSSFDLVLEKLLDY